MLGTLPPEWWSAQAEAATLQLATQFHQTRPPEPSGQDAGDGKPSSSPRVNVVSYHPHDVDLGGNAVCKTQVHVDVVPENIYAPFTIPHRSADGSKFDRSEKPEIFFGNVDSGAMVSCMDEVFLRAYPRLAEYFVRREEVVYGLGNCRVTILGHLVSVPVSLGTNQEVGSVAFCTFRVVTGQGS